MIDTDYEKREHQSQEIIHRLREVISYQYRTHQTTIQHQAIAVADDPDNLNLQNCYQRTKTVCGVLDAMQESVGKIVHEMASKGFVFKGHLEGSK